MGEKITKFIEYLLVIMFVVFVSVTFFNTVMRYVFNASFAWPQEVSQYLFIYVVFLGAAVGFNRKIHIGVDLITAKLSGTPKKLVSTINYIAIIVFAYILLRYGYDATTVTLTQFSPGLGIKMGYIYAAIPIGAAITIIMVLQLLYQEWFTKSNSEEGR